MDTDPDGKFVPGVQGVKRSFGAPGVPVDEGRYKRYHMFGMVEDDNLFDPASGTPFSKMGAFREASQTGKSHGLIALDRQPVQDTKSADVRAYLFTQPPRVMNGPGYDTGSIDPWGTVSASPNIWNTARTNRSKAGV